MDAVTAITEIQGNLMTSPTPLMGCDIYFADNPLKPEKSAYPWCDIIILDSQISHDITSVTYEQNRIVFRVYSRTQSTTDGTIIARQEELTETADWVIHALDGMAAGIEYVWVHVIAKSRPYLEKDAKNCSAIDIDAQLNLRTVRH